MGKQPFDKYTFPATYKLKYQQNTPNQVSNKVDIFRPRFEVIIVNEMFHLFSVEIFHLFVVSAKYGCYKG